MIGHGTGKQGKKVPLPSLREATGPALEKVPVQSAG